jgi:F0F1-type ATP synthase delta subunit
MLTTQELTQTLLQLHKDFPKEAKKVNQVFLKFLSQRNLMYKTSSILRSLESLKKQEEENKTLFLKVGKKIDDKTIQEILSQFKLPQKAKLEIILNKNLKGGFVINFQGKIYEGSLQHQINELKNSLII